MRASLLYYYVLLCWVGCVGMAQAQAPDTLALRTASGDSTVLDLSKVKLSADGLDDEVAYGAQDSSFLDNVNKLMYLWGEAYVQYKTTQLRAAQIIIDFKNNVATAEGVKDSSGVVTGLPDFEDGDQKFKAQKLKYNFKTKQGIVYEVSSQQNDLYVFGAKTKFKSKAGDSTSVDDVIYNSNALFTTCNLAHPHFGIRSAKQKVIPNKLIVIGPSNLEIADVPTPLLLPFGFFPISKGARAGILIPRDYEYSPLLGYGISNIGYYTPLGDHADFTLLSDVYFRGTVRLRGRTNYKQRYRYTGNAELGYAYNVQEIPLTLDKSVSKAYSLVWSHNQDSKAHPYNTFGGSINIQTNNYRSTNFNDANNVLTNTLQSNLTFRRQFPNKPYNMSAAFTHSQNTRTRQMTINFPTVDFQTQTLFPFKKIGAKKPGEQWYEKLSFQYKGRALTQFNALDTTLFRKETLKNAQYGVRHDVSTNVNFRILKYFNLAPFVTYAETWYFKTIRKELNPALLIQYDTLYLNPLDTTEFTLTPRDTAFGKIDTLTKYGFAPFRSFNTGVNLTTQIFGTLQFKRGWLRGVRHVIKPTFTFNYTPDISTAYFDSVDTDTRAAFNRRQRYSYFEGGILGVPSGNGRQATLVYNINNIFEGKFFSRKDSTIKKVKLFDNILIGGNYNLAADSLHFSEVRMSGTARFFKGLTTLLLSANFDPYMLDTVRGVRINKFIWNEKKRPLRFVTAQANLATNMSVGNLIALLRGKSIDAAKTPPPTTAGTMQSLYSIVENFTLNHSLVLQLRALNTGKDTLTVSINSLSTRGSLPITPKWSIDIGNLGYDFKSKQLTYPEIGFHRDLHCWEMGMAWQPTRGTYVFYLRVKPSSLGFLNLPYRKNQFDAAFDR